MDKLDLERCKKDKEEYDEKIRSLDYKIVETSVEMYNSKSYNSKYYQEDNEDSKMAQLKNIIIQFESEKENLTKEFWDKLVTIKTEFGKIINAKIKENSREKSIYIMASFTLNKITDVYFEPNELIELSNLLDDEENNIIENSEIIKVNDVETNEKSQISDEIDVISDKIDEKSRENINSSNNIPSPAVVRVERPFEIEENFKPIQPTPQFNIKEQRIVDFENLLNHIGKISKDYRVDIEKALSRFIINYQIVKNTQYLQNDFYNITNNYLAIFKNIVQKFQKDESIDALQDGIQVKENKTKEIENKILTNNIEMKEIERKLEKLSSIYFVGGYVRKILKQVTKAYSGQNQSNEEDTNKISNVFVPNKDETIEYISDDVFQKIKKLVYDKRMNHIIDVSKWTKNIEEKLKIFHLEESDFQFVIYMIRQTENECNSNFEQVANIIIRLCDANIHLEQIEESEKNKNKKLQEEVETIQIMKDGIENIRKKYSKMPFIGRKVSSILNAKLLNE